MSRSRVRGFGCAAAALAAVAAVGALAWPAATWLQCRELLAGAARPPDAVYLVAGARDQDRRVEAVACFCAGLAAGRTAPLPVLVGNDAAPGRWSRAHGRNLSRAEWGVEKLRARLAPDSFRIEIVPGSFRGTDGEMEALAAWLGTRADIRGMALGTSPYHARRTVRRFRRHAGDGARAYVVPARGKAVDRMPWVVLAELGKMARDGLGLSRAPLLSREGGVMRIGWVDGLSLLAAGLVVYAWAVYPLALALLSRRARSAGPAGSAAAGARPRVAVILAAHNEERHIEDRLRNLQEADYPADRVAVYVGSDGSTDRTAEIAAAFASRGRVTVAAFPERRGKAAVLKDLAAAALGAAPRPEVLVFTDANTVFRSDALAELVCPFSDPRVGAVCGGLSLGAPDAASPEGAYWRWENRMKRMESAVDSCLGVNGAIYAMRAELFWDALPANTVVDDFVLGMKVRERGGRVVYAPRAVAEEELPERAHEWGRRVRIGAGDYQALVLCRRCLLPRFGWFAWMFWSHKVLRWFTPHLLLAMAAAAAVAWLRGRGAGGFMGKAVTALFVAMLLAAAVGRAAPGAGRLFRSCEHFVAMNAALFAGFVRFCRGGLKGHWTRTPR